jgi:hypothetical protein
MVVAGGVSRCNIRCVDVVTLVVVLGLTTNEFTKVTAIVQYSIKGSSSKGWSSLERGATMILVGIRMKQASVELEVKP